MAAIVLCLAVICVVPVLWSAYKEKTTQRKLAESARQCRVRAERGDTDAQYGLGSVYYYGKGVPLDYAEAIRWYRKSADQGVPQDSVEAARWRLKVLEQAVLHCLPRVGWTPWVVILLALAAFAVWGHVKWLSWALMAGAGAIHVLHVISGTFWSGPGRVLVIAIFTMLSVGCALGAVIAVVHGTKPGVEPSHPPAIP